MTISPLAPTAFPALPAIAGIGLATAASGTRYKGRDDLLLMMLVPASTVAGVFTKSDTAAAPVCWSRTITRRGTAAAIITNAGNANAFTGTRGDTAVSALTGALATDLGCQPDDILVASTGVIGEPLDAGKLTPFFPSNDRQSNRQLGTGGKSHYDHRYLCQRGVSSVPHWRC